MKLIPPFNRMTFFRALFFVLGAAVLLPNTAGAATAAEINRSARAGLRKLYASTRAARSVGERATAVLVFPSIVKGGFIVGAQGGEGALGALGVTTPYENTDQQLSRLRVAKSRL